MMLAPTSKGVGLPDDGLFPATGNLPPLSWLHFSNAAPATSPQTRQLPALGHGGCTQTFQFPVPPATYTALYLVLGVGGRFGKFHRHALLFTGVYQAQ